jgi:hypothetical protein
MAKQFKKPADLNRLAAAIVGEATDETPQEPERQQIQSGREGGRKGGKARAEKADLVPTFRNRTRRCAGPLVAALRHLSRKPFSASFVWLFKGPTPALIAICSKASRSARVSFLSPRRASAVPLMGGRLMPS